MSRIERLLTIGIYGWKPESFFGALEDAGVDVLVDVRARRGVRGADYSFANHKRLVESLAGRGIAYVHIRELAPTPEVRAIQAQADKSGSVAKRSRGELSPAFVDAYRGQVLGRVMLPEVIHKITTAGTTPALLCVERLPAACHRSLLAPAVSGYANDASVVDLEP